MMERKWAMPYRWTFKIKPIAKLLKQEMNGGRWIDPYAGMHSPAHIRNDLNPKANAQFHMDALEFLKQQLSASFEGAMLDPPYNQRQLKVTYSRAGYEPPSHIFSAKYLSDQKDELARIIKPGGKCISFGWNSVGLGKTRGFKLRRILLVSHGRQINDTICTVEMRVNNNLF